MATDPPDRGRVVGSRSTALSSGGTTYSTRRHVLIDKKKGARVLCSKQNGSHFCTEVSVGLTLRHKPCDNLV